MTFVLAGDVMLGRGVAQWLDGDWGAAFAEVRPWLSGEDRTTSTSSLAGRAQTFAFANLESPLTTAPAVREGYDLRAPPAAVAALRAGGFDALSLANNHALDAGVAGLEETASALQAGGIEPWMDRTMAPKAGWPPAGAASGAPAYIGLAFDDSAAPLDVEAAAAAVGEAAARADVVVVSIHWGGEYQAAPSDRQEAIARALADAGALVIAGHGPHVLQRVEWVGETLVAYSLGNFLFDQPYPDECRWGVVLRVTVEGGRVTAVEALPTVSERGRVRAADPRRAEAILERLGLEGSNSVDIGQ